MRRIVLALAMTIGLAIGTIVPASALGETGVTLNCSDGTSVKLLLEADALMSLTQAVQAMIEYPAGLSCTLIQNPLGVTFGQIALAARDPFIVAGGRWQVSCAAIAGGQTTPGGSIEGGVVARARGAWLKLSDPSAGSSNSQATEGFFWVNIAVNFHRDKNGVPFGTLNETIPNQTCTVFGPDSQPFTFPVGESHFQSKPLCYTDIISERAPVYTTSEVTHVSGQRPFPTGGTVTVDDPPIFVAGPPVKEHDVLHFGFQDSGVPPGQATTGTTDTLAGPPETPEGVLPTCNSLEWSPDFPLGMRDGSKQYGNITVHQ
jgi:hypothetical protein